MCSGYFPGESDPEGSGLQIVSRDIVRKGFDVRIL